MDGLLLWIAHFVVQISGTPHGLPIKLGENSPQGGHPATMFYFLFNLSPPKVAGRQLTFGNFFNRRQDSITRYLC